MPADSTQGLNAVPAHLLGTRQAIFHLIRGPVAPDPPMPDRLADRVPDHAALRPAARPQTPPLGLAPERTTVLLRDLLSEDRFVF